MAKVPKKRKEKQLTAILFSYEERPSLIEAMTAFRVTAGRLVLEERGFEKICQDFKSLHTALNSTLDSDLNLHEPEAPNINAVFMIPYQTCSKVGGYLKYGTQIFGGYDIKFEDGQELEKLLINHQAVIAAIFDQHSLRDNSTCSIAFLKRKKLLDNSKAGQAWKDFEKAFNPLLVDAFRNSQRKLRDWHTRCRWIDVSDVMLHAIDIPVNDQTQKLAA